MERLNLAALNRIELESIAEELGEEKWRSEQIIRWIHRQQVIEILAMNNLPKPFRKKLAEKSYVRFPEIVESRLSEDGTRKWLLKIDEKNRIETVYIPEESRATLCISSQAGCVFSCSFCATARQGFARNLTVSEIIGQVWLARRIIEKENLRPVSNVVFMGMGEPLANLKNTVSSIELMRDDHTYGLSKKRITLSTSGLVPAIYKLKEKTDVNLAVSLHASNNDLRDTLIPLNKRYPIEMLLKACWNYASDWKKRTVTFEYVMLSQINDSLDDAKGLVKHLKGKPSKVNLIPFNPIDRSSYTCSTLERIEHFSKYLMQHGIFTSVRKTRGQDIEAACGQLVDMSQ